MRAHRGVLHPLLVLSFLVSSCGSSGPPLHEREVFDGDVELSGEGGGAFEGHLLFQRELGRLQFTYDGDGTPVMLTRDAEGRVRAFEVEAWRDASEREAEWFRLVEQVVEPREEGASHEPRSGGYAIRVEGRWVEVRID